MLDDMAELRTFVRIATEGSLSAAARRMGVSLSLVSKRLAALEARTRTLLVARSTRRLALTDEGARLFERVQRILAEVDEAEAVLAHGRLEVQGLLRISAPVALGRAHVAPVCRDLARDHPGISIELVLTDAVSELIDEAFDVAIRIGEPAQPGLTMRKLAESYRVIVASQAYLDERGMPQVPEDLLHHDCLHQGVGTHWRLTDRNGPEVVLPVRSRLRCNNGEVWHDWALEGAGLAMKSWVDVAADIEAGRLVRVLPGWCSPPAPVCALMVSRSLIPTRLRVFLEAMATRLRAVEGIFLFRSLEIDSRRVAGGPTQAGVLPCALSLRFAERCRVRSLRTLSSRQSCVGVIAKSQNNVAISAMVVTGMQG
ncbi:LysR family transcriptional regulator [Novosphingobium sp. 9]|uniref:LysR family transcriptional regulator n=1 Tax=Novosphingobium sp. 9 TaxID=2025349 RepID=UPI0021B6A0EE|nr:LysR family transcriptional regulator [Novosphingobium sp. 9]